ncbi:hypothetical protein BGZ46_004888 [Entomortierella lignicola]|nr:hypothetical protein BGZ46_004888 [Entomortierella lignicola]
MELMIQGKRANVMKNSDNFFWELANCVEEFEEFDLDPDPYPPPPYIGAGPIFGYVGGLTGCGSTRCGIDGDLDPPLPPPIRLLKSTAPR